MKHRTLHVISPSARSPYQRSSYQRSSYQRSPGPFSPLSPPLSLSQTPPPFSPLSRTPTTPTMLMRNTPPLGDFSPMSSITDEDEPIFTIKQVESSTAEYVIDNEIYRLTYTNIYTKPSDIDLQLDRFTYIQEQYPYTGEYFLRKAGTLLNIPVATMSVYYWDGSYNYSVRGLPRYDKFLKELITELIKQ